MGLGSKEKERRIYFMSLRSTKDKKTYPHFVTKVKEPGGQVQNLPDEFKVSGYLVSIAHNEYEWPKDSGDKHKTVILYLVDGEDMFKVETNIDSMMTRSLMNTVLGTPDWAFMKISVRAKNEQSQIFVSNNDQKTNWRFRWKEDLTPLIYEVEDPKSGKMVKVYRKVNELLWNEWLKLEPAIAENAKAKGYDKYVQQNQESGNRPQEETDALQKELDAMDEPTMQQSSQEVHPMPSTDDLPF